MHNIGKSYPRRILRLAALGAPIVYLFGAMLCGLWGANGEQVWAQEKQNEYISVNKMLSGVSMSLDGVLTQDNRFYTTEIYKYKKDMEVKFYLTNTTSNCQLRYCTFDENNNLVNGVVLYPNTQNIRSTIISDPNNNISHVRFSLYQKTDWEGIEFVNYETNYSETIFGNFFPRDNFLVKWGENAVGDNPAGFAPFGAFFKYMDDNVTHFKDANQQIGLMAYGYLYYVAHVLIADMALLCITFIPKLLDKINDKILGGLDND